MCSEHITFLPHLNFVLISLWERFLVSSVAIYLIDILLVCSFFLLNNSDSLFSEDINFAHLREYICGTTSQLISS